jgi:hypothetical protein
MKIKTMILRENLSVSDVADLVTRLGQPMDRTNAARALRDVAIEGIEEPGNPRGSWRIPRAKLVEVVAACVLRRRRRSHGRGAVTLDGCLLDAAEAMLREDDLLELVPKQLRRKVYRRLQARWEAEQERRRRQEEFQKKVDEAVWGKFRAETERRRREHDELVRAAEEYRREKEAKEQQRLFEDTYRVCRQQAMRDCGVVQAPGWIQDTKNQPFLREWPGSPPDWWAPPPGLLAVVKVEAPKFYITGYQPPDWRRWVPPYQPGKPWPWRSESSGPQAEAVKPAA